MFIFTLSYVLGSLANNRTTMSIVPSYILFKPDFSSSYLLNRREEFFFTISASKMETFWDLAYWIIFTLIIVVNYYLWIVPMNRIRTLDDVGFAHLKLAPKIKAHRINQLRRGRKPGNPPPPFPNGWYVVAESREVKMILKSVPLYL